MTKTIKAVENFGTRLRTLIDYLLKNEEPVQAYLAKRFGVSPQAFYVWHRGEQKSVHKGRYGNIATVTGVSEKTLRGYLDGSIAFDQLVEERLSDSPLNRVLREVEKLSRSDKLQLNWVLANDLREIESTSAIAALPTVKPKTAHNFVSFDLAERVRLQRYGEAVKKSLPGGSEGIITQAIANGADPADARILLTDILTAEPRLYCESNFTAFLGILPKILDWKGDLPILDNKNYWLSFEELVYTIKELTPDTQCQFLRRIH